MSTDLLNYVLPTLAIIFGILTIKLIISLIPIFPNKYIDLFEIYIDKLDDLDKKEKEAVDYLSSLDASSDEREAVKIIISNFDESRMYTTHRLHNAYNQCIEELRVRSIDKSLADSTKLSKRLTTGENGEIFYKAKNKLIQSEFVSGIREEGSF